MKRAEMSIQLIFLIFIATIAAFVIVGMITKSSISASSMMDKLFGEDDEPIIDVQLINLTKCDNVDNEITKHAKLCYTKGQQGLVKGELCYGIIMPTSSPSGCSIQFNTISTKLEQNKINYSISATSPAKKILVSFDYDKTWVKIY
jgi:hypothetical protein